jgi:glycosidase
MINSVYDPALTKMLDVHPTEITTPSGKKLQYPSPSPTDWRDTTIYFLLIDRFNNPTKKPISTSPDYGQYQGGTFEGIRQQLPYLKEMGVGTIWLSPVLMNPQWFKDFWGGYCIMDFMHIEPRFCKDRDAALKNPNLADDEFRSLVDEIHAQGMYVVMDIVLNHTADVFNYEGMRDSAPWKNDGTYQVYWRDEKGTPQGNWTDIKFIPNLKHEVGIWPTELQRNEFFRRQGDALTSPDPVLGDFDRMKELVTDYVTPTTGLYPVRDTLIRVYQYLISRFDIDGYRIDTIQHIETDFAHAFGNAIREYALSIGKKNFFTYGEVWQEDNEEKISQYIGRNTVRGQDTVGVDAAIDFPIRKRLVSFAKGMMPACELANHFEYRKKATERVVSSHGEASRYFVTFLDNHDMHERITCKGYEDQTKLALTCLMTIQGIPCIYYGTEQGLTGHGNRCENVREALWGQTNAFSTKSDLYKLISDLNKLRTTEPALRYGRQYFRPCSGNGVDFGISTTNGGILTYSRILNDREVVVVANSSTTSTTTVHVLVDSNLSSEGDAWEILLSTQKSPTAPKPAATHVMNRTVQVTLAPMETQVIAKRRR